MNLAQCFSRAGSMGTVKVIQLNQSLLNTLKWEVDPNIQAMCNQEKARMKSLNKFASFIGKLWSLEQQNKILETKWSLLQQQKMTHSNMDNMFKACINNQQRQLETLAQEKLRLKAEFGNVQGLVEDLKNK